MFKKSLFVLVSSISCSAVFANETSWQGSIESRFFSWEANEGREAINLYLRLI